LDQAVKAYAGDLESGRETIRPLPWWANGHQGAEAAAGKEDTLLSILRLFSTTRAYPADLEALFDPKTISGSAINTRLAWQLATILSAKGWTDYLPKDKYDQLTRDFAAELENASKFVSATWVLLHMTDVQARELLVRELLMRNGGHIPEPLPMGGAHEQTEPDVFRYLSQDNQIPELLLWEAKALYAKAELKNPYLQTDYLLTAQLYDQAHEVVCQTIGPMAVIEEEYHDLAVLLGRFSNASEKPVGWESGGQVFDDFTRMCSMPAHRKNGREWKGLVEKLRSGLEAMQNSTSAVHMTLEGRVAMVEMERKMREEARDAEVGARDGRVMEGVVGAKVEVPELWMRYRAAMALVT
jgi:nuclear pore complex protein Nup98-Nup96